MSSYLAEVEMPKREEPEIDEIELREEVEISEVSEEVEEPQDDGVEEAEVLPPPPAKKDKLKSEDIFKRKKPPAKQTAPVPEIAPITVNHEEPIIPSEKPVKKKRQMSEKQLAALARGREKRAANKKAKAQAPATATAPQPAAVYEAPPPTPQPREKLYSQKEVEELIFQGVSRYDNIRKQQKAEKRVKQAKQAHEQKVFSTINTAMTNNNPDPWASAFTF